MLPGETIRSGAPNICDECKTTVYLTVLESAAGFYIGTQCKCGPYSRESAYYPTRKSAREALDNDTVNWR